jgi:acyl carrier protein
LTDSISVIRHFIRSLGKVGTDDDLFSDDVDLFDYGYLDSFGIVGLIEDINETFKIDLSDVDFYEPGHRTIQGIANLVDLRKAES